MTKPVDLTHPQDLEQGTTVATRDDSGRYHLWKVQEDGSMKHVGWCYQVRYLPTYVQLRYVAAGGSIEH